MFFYNSAQYGFPENNTGYHPAFVILNGSNVHDILQRSKCDEPLLLPLFTWETGTDPYTCNVPNVVFLEAAVKMNANQTNLYLKRYGNNTRNVNNDLTTEYIRVYFGGSDSVVGTAVIAVAYPT